MKIPRDFIEQVLARTDIVDLINTHFSLQKSGGNYFARCPFHQEKRASFSVSHPKQFFHCFGCGAHGNAIDFIMQYEHLSFPEAVGSLAKQAGLVVPHTISAEKEAPVSLLFDLMTDVVAFYQFHLQNSKKAEAYLNARGVIGPIVKQFNLGYAPAAWALLLDRFGKTENDKKRLVDAGLIIQKEDGSGHYDRFRDRIIFPIQDHRGRTVGFGGRALDNIDPKYLNSPETALFQKGHELYGLYQALKLNRKLEQVLVVEGYMDVIALFQHDITYVVATLGTATTAHHFHRLTRYTSTIIFCFDGDAAGRTAAFRALQVIFPLMQDHLQIQFLFLPEGEDPDTLIRKEGKLNFEKRLAHALPLSTFFLQSMGASCDLTTMEGRARFAASALGYIQQLPEGILSGILLDELAKLARVSLTDLKKQLKKPPSTAQALLETVEIKPQSKLKPPMQAALALVVQEPALAHLITDPLPDSHLLGHSFLQQLIDLIKQMPAINTAGLIEHWRGQKEERFIARLACWKHTIPENGMAKEFLGTLRQIRLLGIEEKINGLMDKARREDLDEEEKQSLSAWIIEKQGLSHIG